MSAADGLQRDWWREHPTWLTRALAPLALLYGALSASHRALYRLGVRRPAGVRVPTIVVGNLVVGGAGKTPVLIALLRDLKKAGWTPGVVSRGYGRHGHALRHVEADGDAREVGDEPLLIRLRTGAPVVVADDRAAAARSLCEAHPEVDALLSDDGLQHRRLARRLNVLVFDERGAGNRKLLPAGPLREPLPRSLPARTLVVYNAERASTPLPGCLVERRLAGAVALADWWRGAEPSLQALHTLRGRRLCAAAGMGHPERFFAMLEAQGLQIERLPLPDHHDFATLPWSASTPDVVLTEKDAVKIDPRRAGATRIWVVALDLRLPAAFVTEVQRILRMPETPAS
jgi:tetraacyldisaccharide 4'-kinase